MVSFLYTNILPDLFYFCYRDCFIQIIWEPEINLKKRCLSSKMEMSRWIVMEKTKGGEEKMIEKDRFKYR